MYPIGNTAPGEADARFFNQAFREADVDVVSLGSDATDSEIEEFERDDSLAAILTLTGPGPELRPVADLPASSIPYLPIDPFLTGVAIRRSVVSEDGLDRFDEVGSALREWLVRVVTTGRTIRVQHVESETPRTDWPRLRPANPGRTRRWLADGVDAMSFTGVKSEPDAAALRAGFLQINDFLDHSHEYSQSVQGEGTNAAGDYWHAIMHRREPDYSNAKYWFRRVGPHVIFGDLAAAVTVLLEANPGIAGEWGARLLPSGEWDPFAFVDLCESRPRGEDDALSQFAQRVQWIEMLLLLQQTHADALGAA